MDRTPLLFIILMLGVALPLPAAPQQQESLGDLARQLREQRAKDTRKAVKVFTNDNLPARPHEEAAAAQPAPPPTDKQPAKPAEPAAKPADSPSGQETSSEPGDKVRTRDYWQEKFKTTRQSLSHAKELQELAEDELNLLQIQQVRELDPEVKQALTHKVEAKQSEVDVNKAATAAAQKALDDLEKEFKESGAPDDWSQTDEQH
jgi:hypothetical protein